jgi:hypothetical protein
MISQLAHAQNPKTQQSSLATATQTVDHLQEWELVHQVAVHAGKNPPRSALTQYQSRRSSSSDRRRHPNSGANVFLTFQNLGLWTLLDFDIKPHSSYLSDDWPLGGFCLLP